MLLQDAETDFLLARDAAGSAVGFAQVRYRYSAWLSGRMAELKDLFVTAAARRIGVGRALLAYVFDRARSRGCGNIGLTTNERNAGAVALYRALGFKAERVRWDGGRQLWFECAL